MQLNTDECTIEKLDRHHNRRGFRCGVEELDYYIGKVAMQHAEKDISKTNVLVCDENKTVIIGFYTLAPCEVRGVVLPESRAKKLPKHSVPAGKLGRLAVAIEFQSRGFGESLLMDAMLSFLDAVEKIGMIGLFVDAVDERVANFYEKYGFVRCNDDPLHLFIPTQDIKAAFDHD